MTEAIVYIMCSSVLSFIVKAGELHICEALWEGTIGDSEGGILPEGLFIAMDF